jgi:ribosomal-protein-alanine N-acetyltransferase
MMPPPASLATERLIIRPYGREDLESLFLFFNDIRVTRYTDLPDGRTRKETAAFLDYILASYTTEDPLYAFAVTLKESGEIIGSCGFAPLEDDGTGAQIYYAFFPDYWGKGYATEASRKMIELVFSIPQFERIVVDASPENPASARVAERLGMHYFGLVQAGDRPSLRYLLTCPSDC